MLVRYARVSTYEQNLDPQDKEGASLGFIDKFSEQFRKPGGFWGHMAGMLMATTTGSRNEWTLSLLEIRP